MEIKVSVILTIYNVEEFLEECLQSLINQSMKEIEIICVDDGSTDGSLAIVEKYATIDERIIVVKQENQGAAAARNNGFKYARGKYVSFLDSDDFYEKNMYEKAYDAAEEQKSDVVIFRGDKYNHLDRCYMPMDYSIKRAQLPNNNPFSYKDMPDEIFTFAVGWAWDKLYRTDFVKENNLSFQEIRTSNDLKFTFSSLVAAKSIYVIDDILIHHRVNASKTLSVTREKSWDCFYKAINELKNELIKMQVYEEVEKGFLNWVVHFSFWNLDTIEGIAYKKVYELLKNKCFVELNICDKHKEYFKDEKNYIRMREIIEKDFDEYVIQYMIHNRKLADERAKKLSEKTRELVEKNNEISNIKNSTTFRVGKKVMCIPIKVKKLIRGEK